MLTLAPLHLQAKCFTRMLAKINVSFNCVMLQTNNCKQNLTDEFGNSMKISICENLHAFPSTGDQYYIADSILYLPWFQKW